MIELRWIVRPIPEQPTHGTVKVLQFRTQTLQMHTKPMGTTSEGHILMGQVPSGYGWTDWNDVPTVDGSSAAECRNEEKK